MTRQTSSTGGGEPGPPDETRPEREPPTLAVSPSESMMSDRSATSSRQQRQVTFLKPAADTTLDRKASIVDETTGITRTQMREFREAFRLFDKDGDGTITKEELGRVMRSLGQFARVEELQDMLKEVDSDGDGNVSFEEFVSILSKSMSGGGGGPTSAEQEERELRDAFRVFDKHNRGYICASDLRAVLQCLGEDLGGGPTSAEQEERELRDAFRVFDKHNRGYICASDLRAVLQCGPTSAEQEERELRDAFRVFDKHNRGYICASDLRAVLQCLGEDLSEEERCSTSTTAGTSARRTCAPCCSAWEKICLRKKVSTYIHTYSGGGSTSAEQEERELRDAFRVFGKHNRGYICASDLRAVLQCLGEDLSEEEIEDMIKEVDSDGDGRIDFLEFVRALGEPEDACDDDEDDDVIESPDIQLPRPVAAN
ncbi:EF hand domain-containing protein [Phthorimaea operculella]|nr:EF hand domain-containing protein [Phthorimaea operculella]